MSSRTTELAPLDLKITSFGSTHRHELRFKPDPLQGGVNEVVATMDTAMGVYLPWADEPELQTAPTVVLRAKTSITDYGDDSTGSTDSTGSFTMTTDVVECYVQADSDTAVTTTVSDVSQLLDQLRGARLESVMSSNGQTQIPTIYPREGVVVGPEARRMLEQEGQWSGCTFPDQPIGIGAEWTASRELRHNEMDVTRTSNSRLVEFDPKSQRGVVETTSHIVGSSQWVTYQDTTLWLRNYNGVIISRVEFDLTNPCRLRGDHDVKQLMSMAPSEDPDDVSFTMAVMTRVHTERVSDE